MKFKLKATFIFLLIISLIMAWVFRPYFSKQSPSTFPRPGLRPVQQKNKTMVSTYTVIPHNWQVALQSMGNVKASQSILIASEVPGLVTHIHFDSGQTVTEGQLLVDLRADGIKAALEKAEISLQDDLKNYQRKKKLLSAHYISVEEVERSKAMVEKERSDVKEQKAFLAQHTITAPFSGVLGLRQVQKGQYITTGQSLVNLESLDPAYVDFTVPGKWTSRIKTGEAVEISSDAYPGEIFTGTIRATSHAIDLNTRSLEVRAAVPNPQKKLLSGMAVSVSIHEPNQNRIIVPQSALAYTPDGVGIYVIDEKGISHWHPVTVGERDPNNAAILSGIKLGDTIVIAGQQKLREGALVAVNNQNMLMDNKT